MLECTVREGGTFPGGCDHRRVRATRRDRRLWSQTAWPSVIASSRMDHSISTIGPTRIAPVGRDVVIDIVAHHPRIGAALWWSAMQEEAMLRERIVALGRRSAAQLCRLSLVRTRLSPTGDRRGRRPRDPVALDPDRFGRRAGPHFRARQPGPAAFPTRPTAHLGASTADPVQWRQARGHCWFHAKPIARRSARLICRALRRSKPARAPRKSGSHMTQRWRKPDSNPRSPRKGQHFFETAADLATTNRPVARAGF